MNPARWSFKTKFTLFMLVYCLSIAANLLMGTALASQRELIDKLFDVLQKQERWIERLTEVKAQL
jgi:hypothetical protein